MPKRDWIFAPHMTEADRVLSRIAAEAGLTVKELRGPRQSRRFAWPRQRAYTELAELGLSLPQIGRKMGGRHHSTVLYGIRAHEAREAAP